MSIKSGTAAQAPETPLGGVSIVQCEGTDALRFVQAQVSSDAAALQPGQWQWSSWLTPKGRVIAAFALLRLDDARLWLVLPDGRAEAIATALSRYVFRSKVRVAVLPCDALARRDWPAGHPAPVADRALVVDGTQWLDWGHPARPRWLGLRVRHDDASATPADTRAADAAWLADDIALGLPRLSDAAVEQFTAHMLGLDRLGALGLRKGCYPGHEIVARTHYLGQSRRTLRRVQGCEAPVAPGDILRHDQPAGTVLVASGVEALAVLPADLTDDDALRDAGGRPLRLLPFEPAPGLPPPS